MIYMQEVRQMLSPEISGIVALDDQLWCDIGPAMTCTEIDAFLSLFYALGMDDTAAALLAYHAEEDDEDEGDSHFLPTPAKDNP